MILSSSFVFLFASLIGFFALFKEGFGAALSFFIIYGCLTGVLTFFSYSVPIIDPSRIYINYIINVFAQILILRIMMKMGD